MKRFDLETLLEIAIFAGFAMVIDLFPSFKPNPSVSISFAMVPIFIIAFRRGFLAASISGFLWGILQIATGDAWILTPTQAFIEYFIAFTCIGFAGLFSNLIKSSLKDKKRGATFVWIVIATFIGSVARYFWHFVAGVIFFKNYAIEAGKTPVIFSLTMNGMTFLGASILCAIILVLLINKAPQLITNTSERRQQAA